MNDESAQKPRYLRAILGALVGAFLGYLGFSMLVQMGIYGMVIPGAMIGLGCGAQARGRSFALGAFAAMLSLVFSIFLEWHFFPFSEDVSLSFFLANLTSLPAKTKLIMCIGTFAGFWFGRGRAAVK